MLQKIISNIREGISEVLFPHVCTICSDALSITELSICTNCLSESFEMANPDYRMSSAKAILPEGVELQTALWGFDKGGLLQELLHALKYAQRPDIGEDLGKALGWELNRHPYINRYSTEELCLLPVPLHSRKKRKRGYNQAYHIAIGVSQATGYEVCGEDDIVRVKNTATQTGFDLRQRGENISGAFEVKSNDNIKKKVVIIVDDVFTTGATTFELSAILKKAGARKIFIATVAQA